MLQIIDPNHIKDLEIVDVRIPDIFELGFIPSAINIGLNGPFDERMPRHFPNKEQKLLVISNNNEEAFNRLKALGYNNLFFLENGFQSYQEAQLPIDVIISISAEEFELDLNYKEECVIDVRQAEKYNEEHVLDAINIPSSEIENSDKLPDKNTPVYLYCNGGYTSMISASILRKKGYTNIKNIYGGIKQLRNTKIPILPTKK